MAMGSPDCLPIEQHRLPSHLQRYIVSGTSFAVPVEAESGRVNTYADRSTFQTDEFDADAEQSMSMMWTSCVRYEEVVEPRPSLADTCATSSNATGVAPFASCE
jgi:hypothetical protein